MRAIKIFYTINQNYRFIEMRFQGRLALLLIKGVQRYIVFADDESSVKNGLRTLGRWASDPGYDFSWLDASVLSQRLRRAMDEEQDVVVRIADMDDGCLGI